MYYYWEWDGEEMDFIDRCDFEMNDGILMLKYLLIVLLDRLNIWFVDVGFFIFVLKVGVCFYRWIDFIV